MGRIIGGAVVGLVSMGMVAFLFGLGLMLILGADGMVDSDRSPTATWLVSSLVVAFGVAALGAVIARAIGKDKRAVYIFGGIVVLYSIYGFISSGSATAPEIDPATPEWMKEVIEAIYDAQANGPGWLPLVSTVATLGGIAVGGFNKGDFAKPSGHPNETD